VNNKSKAYKLHRKLASSWEMIANRSVKKKGKKKVLNCWIHVLVSPSLPPSLPLSLQVI